MTMNGNITDKGGMTIAERGFVYVLGTAGRDPIYGTDSKVSETSSDYATGAYSLSASGMASGTQYRVRAFAKSTAGVSYGTFVYGTTLSAPGGNTAPTGVSTGAYALSPGTTTVDITGSTVATNGGSALTEKGVYYGTTPSPTSNKAQHADTNVGSFNITITGLTRGVDYYFRAYATNAIGTTYGTSIGPYTIQQLDPTVAVIITKGVTDITPTTATCGGTVTTSVSGATTLAVGVVWGTQPGTPPTVDDPGSPPKKTIDPIGLDFISYMTNLTQGATYYVRSYITYTKNSVVTTVYGTDPMKVFTTSSIPQAPVVSTAPVRNITATSALCGGNVLTDGTPPS